MAFILQILAAVIGAFIAVVIILVVVITAWDLILVTFTKYRLPDDYEEKKKEWEERTGKKAD